MGDPGSLAGIITYQFALWGGWRVGAPKGPPRADSLTTANVKVRGPGRANLHGPIQSARGGVGPGGGALGRGFGDRAEVVGFCSPVLLATNVL